MTEPEPPVAPQEWPTADRRQVPSQISERLDMMQASTDRLTSAVNRLVTVIDRVDRAERKADNAEHTAVETSQLVVHNSEHMEQERSRLARRGAGVAVVLAALAVAGGAVIVKRNAAELEHRNQTSRFSCEARNAAQTKSAQAIDSFLAGLEQVERSNPSSTVAAARITVYESARRSFAPGPLPDCSRSWPGTHYP